MSDANLIFVRVPYEDGGDFKGEDSYWAVKPPEDRYSTRGEDGEWVEKSVPTYYYLMGSDEAVVANKESLVGFRALLDAIEKDMTEGELDERTSTDSE